jgi:hypothetical protein
VVSVSRALKLGGETVTAYLTMACLVIGFLVGWLLRSVFVVTEISRSQERMQRKVHYWQCEAARARSVAEHLTRQLIARGLTPDEQDVPPEDDA